jgi:hypothetical protein
MSSKPAAITFGVKTMKMEEELIFTSLRNAKISSF